MSIKIIHTGDMHLGGSYPEKAAASIDFLIEQIEDTKSPAFRPDLFLVTGDTTDKPLHVHSDHLKPLLKLIQSVDCRMVFLQGTPSHEPYNFLRNLQTATGGTITVLDDPCNYNMDVPLHHPDIGSKTIRNIAFAAFPALSRAMLETWALNITGICTETPEENIRRVMESIHKLWADFQGPKILLGHWTVAGCTTGTGQTLYGSDITLSLEDIALSGADAVLLGHIHAAQDWHNFQFVSYCGSTHPCNWGELDVKSFSVLKFDETSGKLVNFQRIPFPHKPMAKFDIEFTGEQRDGEWIAKLGEAEWDRIKALSNAEVKCCYSVPKEIAAQVDDMYVRTMFLNHGLDLAAVERTIKSSSRERIADIASKETTRQQYEAVCAAKGEEPRPGALTKADFMDELGVGL